jgi:hypothetical protein
VRHGLGAALNGLQVALQLRAWADDNAVRVQIEIERCTFGRSASSKARSVRYSTAHQDAAHTSQHGDTQPNSNQQQETST